jgi:alkylation response protein AidB-like acyl-CoA dehydrogenase
VNFLLDDDQLALQEGIRNLCAGRFPVARVRNGFDRDGWKELAAAGVFTVAEVGGVAEAAVVFEELGRALVPGPLVWGYLARRDDVVVAGAERSSPIVAHLDHADVVVIVDNGGVASADRDSVAGEPIPRPLDPLSPAWWVDWPPGERIEGADAADWRRRGAVVVAAQLVGLAAATTDLAVAYAKERHQFDRPIGAFQAVKHILADMAVRTEVARAAVHAAAVSVDGGEGGVDRAVSGAKVVAGEAALANGKAATQVHGGMGYTWEVDVHLYLKRAWVLDRLFGSADAHALRLGKAE